MVEKPPVIRRGLRRALRAGLIGCFLIVLAAPVAAEPEYESSQAGHPLRIVAYVLHPVGVILDTLIMRPAYWLGSHEPLRTLFGRTD